MNTAGACPPEEGGGFMAAIAEWNHVTKNYKGRGVFDLCLKMEDAMASPYTAVTTEKQPWDAFLKM